MDQSLKRFLALTLLLLATLQAHPQEKKALGVHDLMKFRQIVSPAISNNGLWVVHTAKPDRGDPGVMVYSTRDKKVYTMDLAEKPALSNDGLWVAAVKTIPVSELEKSDKKETARTGMILLNTETGEQDTFDSVSTFQFSNDSRWLLYQEASFQKKEKSEDVHTGSTLHLRSLDDGENLCFPMTTKFALDSISRYLAYVHADSTGMGNGLFIVDLQNPSAGPLTLYSDSSAWADDLTWNKRTGELAFLAGLSGKKGRREDASLLLWSPGEGVIAALDDSHLEDGWKIYHKNHMEWSKDGKKLFLGIKPESEIIPAEDEPDTVVHLYDVEEILSEREVDVWHWNDPYISSHQKKRWKTEKDRVYTGVYFPADDRFVALAGPEMPDLQVGSGSPVLLGSSNLPYARKVTWDDSYRDYYLVDTETGDKKLILKDHQHSVRISPDGKYLVYYKDKQWYMLDASTLEVRQLTRNLGVPFANEDWDYPADVPGYGVAGWMEGSSAALIYDKYDIWLFPVSGEEAQCLTRGKGREEKYQFRIRKLDREQECFARGETLFLTAYHDLKKHTALYTMKAGIPGVQVLVEEEKKYTLLAKAKEADKLLYTRQSYTEFPDLWTSDLKFRKTVRLSDVNPQVDSFAWGEARLVEWSSIDGLPLQGILISPDNAEPGKRYPVLVYYYRFFTDRLYEFNQIAVNHRPCFPFYASNGYAIFLPDIRFDVGTPGYSATKCLVPGVQKIIDMGVADPDAICLHGHSWSGYQTAFAITQTDIFTCAIAGAPVSNMTSAYSGIRWESGLARQFQYEKTQSRIGGSLWDARDRYIENSPVFFADRINTPLLIQFGDLDGAVPWYQGIELYLAMRRLDKDCIFLQYRGEGHHLKKYANKLDYTLKFKEYLDHYLKGEPAADWITEGVPYQGK